MQPTNPKLTSQAKGAARVNMLMRAHLYWLSGFPDFQHGQWYWCCPDALDADKQQVPLTAALLSKAQRVIYELCRDYPLALPKVVGDVQEWQARCLAYLDFAKRLMAEHDPAGLFSLFEQEASLISKLRARFHPDLWQHRFVTAISWWHYVRRDELELALMFVQDYLLTAKGYEPQLIARLCHIYCEYGEKAAGLLRLQLFNLDCNTATDGLKKYIQPFLEFTYDPKRNNPYSFPTRPVANSHIAVLNSLDSFFYATRNQQKNMLALLNALMLDQVLSVYQQWWERVDPLINKVRNIWQHTSLDKQERIKVLKDQLWQLQQQAPCSFDLATTFAALQTLSKHDDWVRNICLLLQDYPALRRNMEWRALYLQHFELLLSDCDQNKSYIQQYLRGFHQFLAVRDDAEPLDWGCGTTHYWGSYERKIFEHLSSTQFPAFFQLLSLVIAQHNNTLLSRWIEGLAMIIGAGFAGQAALDLALRFIELDKIDDLSPVVLNIAREQHYSLAQTETVFAIWEKLDQEFTVEDTLKSIYQTFQKIQALDLFNQLLFAENIAVIRHCSNQIRIIQQIQPHCPLPTFAVAQPSFAPWIVSYPAEFQTSLAQLNASVANAEAIVRKIFMADWWPKFFIAAEIEQLQQRLLHASGPSLSHIQARLNNLQQHLATHQPPSLATQQKLLNKLQHRIQQAQFQHWKNALDIQLRDSWATFLDIPAEQMPDWLLSEKYVHYWLPIISFNKQNQSLARSAIRQRCLSPDWWFVEHPKNHRYLQQLSAAGFNCQVWLDGIPALNYTSKSGKHISIHRVTDPLDALNMGGYFKSCLSPGSCNYFSVFANIADINKWVIYGKTADQKVIGRVLIALTPLGGIKVFNIYFHHADDEFQPHVMQYIKHWADSAGFTLTDKGNVPCLVAHDWYDDGANEVDHGIACLQPDSTFRQQLAQLAPAVLKQTAIQALAPLPLNELTLPLLAELPELRQSPQLLLELINIAHQTLGLGIRELMRLFQLAHECNHGEQAFCLLRKDLLKKLRNSIKEHWHLNVLIIDYICQYNPADALGLIKCYGNLRHGADWQNNLYHEAANMAIKALILLGRTQQAQMLMEKYKND